MDIFVFCPWNDGDGDVYDGMQLLFPFFLFFCFPIMTRLIFFYFFSLSCSTTAADAAAILRSLQEVLIMI